MGILLQDMRYGVRMLTKNPAFTAIAVLTLAIGIGANTAIFSVVNPVLLRPLPYREPSRLVTVMDTKASQNLDWLWTTQANFVEWRRRADVFESMAASNGCGFRVADESEVHLLQGSCVSSTFFPMLGVRPILGRVWSAEEDLPNQGHVTLLSYTTWKNQFGGDPDVIGKAIWRTQDRASYTIIGILPEDFQFARDDTAVWAPLELPPAGMATHFHEYTVIARLRPGVSVAQAQATMSNIATQLEKETPLFNTGWGVVVRPLQESYAIMSNSRTTLLVLLAAVACLLLIACANVANLLLARATVRQREIAVRVALGASRLRLIRQLLTENLLLGLLGGTAGFFIAWAGFGSLISIAPPIRSFQPNAIRIDGEVFAFSMAASLLASLFFGLTPALRVSKQDLNETLREGGRGTRGTLRDRVARHGLVVGEIAVAAILLTGTGLLVESFRNLEKDSLGFNPDHVLTVGFCCLDSVHASSQQLTNAFYREAFERIRALPGVEAASATTALPMRQFDGGGSVFVIQGQPAPEPGHDTLTDPRLVEPDYFHTMQIPAVHGRVFTAADDETHPLVAVINATMARRYFADKDPIGEQIQLVNLRPQGRWFTIIGVVADSRDRGLGRETRCTLYFSDLQNILPGSMLLVRTKGDPMAVVGPVRDAMRSLNRDITLGQPRTMNRVLEDSLSPQRFSATLFTLFAVLALTLASIGVYGVTAYTVAQRTHEIGVRVALGAQQGDVLRLVLGQGARLALAGVAIGLIGSLALTQLMNTMLFGVGARDPVTLMVVSALLAGMALLASYIPARAAMRVDPMVALRCD
jgi:putative ABC transport system permease protein